MNSKTKLITAAFLIFCVDLAANAVNSMGFSWIYKIPPTDIWDFPITVPKVLISLTADYLWNIVIVIWFLFFISSSITNNFSKNKSAVIFGLLLIGFCLGDWISNFWAILKIPTAVTVYWIALTVVMNLSKSFILSYYYGGKNAQL
ncbi:MAG: hypothetical protein GF409_08195 [Candidatus Omnitrophica bacterium]|nr:hypothetical protein [Candidatus Omnitrophota bacterium]